MTRTFIETSSLKRFIDDRGIGGDSLLREIQASIMEDPERGALIPGTGGTRKLRVADESRGKGKRGGFRVIYFDLADREKTYLLLIYQKGRQDNLSQDEKEEIRNLVRVLK